MGWAEPETIQLHKETVDMQQINVWETLILMPVRSYFYVNTSRMGRQDIRWEREEFQDIPWATHELVQIQG